MILLRHGQSEFNLRFTRTRRDPGIVDPKLTELGHEQALEAAEALGEEQVARIIASPYTRALQTAAYLADRLRVPLWINPLVRERFAFACDVGSPRTELALAWPRWDFSNLDEVWWPAMTESAVSVVGRAALFRAEMIALEDWADTIVVTHWGFIMSMTGLNVANGQWLRVDAHAPPPGHVPWS
jgi:glucosyl-3-phosphoglycerate phosphatase